MTGRSQEQLFLLPDLGEGLTEAEIIDWKVAVGDTVGIDQIVVEVETAKAAVEVPVPYAGTVLRLHAEAGTAVAVGGPLISVGTPQARGATPQTPAPAERTKEHPPGRPPQDPPEHPAEHPAAARYGEEELAGSGNVLIGYGTGHSTPSRRRRSHRRNGAPRPVPATVEAPRVINPLVRRLARDHGVDLARLTPSGPHGIIQRKDVEEALERTAPGPAVGDTEAQRIPLRGVRRAVADKLSRSRTEIPDATTWVDADATALLAAKDALRAADPDARIGLLAVLARITVAGLRRFPELNASVDTGRDEIVRHGPVHLGFAAQTDRGLVVPVVRDAHRMTTTELAAELVRLTELARAGRLPPAALTGGTFTLNNYGVFGVDGSTPIINHPEAGLLGVGRIVDRPWVVGGALAVRKVTQLSFTFDHRVCDGGAAGGFLRHVADRVENPAVLLADL
ncbi:dihydrolipoamide acetyltransferase family protein [Streptomyces sp. NPDC004610]|uniref:dihydrolipoamide acetyltransferase family protein n=1 Tax=unclassified Streptomyces TaxID=2593676 RepID=UPI0033B73CAB